MRMTRRVWALCGAMALSLVVVTVVERTDTAHDDQVTAQSAAKMRVPDRVPRGKISDKFSNIRLVTHDDKQVHFYDDLVKDRKVIINFMYTDCVSGCPLTTANLNRLYDHLRARMGEDLLILSITLSGELDSPQALRMYAEKFGGVRPGWLYLTGNYDEIDALRRALGVYDLDPVVDANKNSHAGILTFGNDKTNRWAALPAMMDSHGIAKTVQWITRN